MLKFKVKKSDAGKRADIFIADQFPEFSRSSLKVLFDKNFVTVDNKVVKASHKLSSGDTVKVDTSLLSAAPEQIDIPVIYEDKDVIVMNKPAGILTHSKGALNAEATVASWLRGYIFKNTPKEILDSRLWTLDSRQSRTGIVHRLDRATSGVIIAAKNEKALKWLQKQFSTRKTNKTYLAVVEGVPNPVEAIIDAPIERNPKKPQTFKVGGGGRPAVTSYKVLEILNPETKILNKLSISNGAGKLYSLLELNPLTGRTHQLRVHLKYIGHPIVGDGVYGHGGENMYLHAKSLEITLPGGQRKKFVAPEPQIFKDFK